MKWKLASVVSGIAVLVVFAEPALKIQQSVNSVIISWPSTFVGFDLQENTNLSGGAWTATPGSVRESGGTNFVTVTATNRESYLRLFSSEAGIYVDAGSGADNNEGTSKQPVATIQRAIALAVAAPSKTNVFVSKGSYNLSGGTLRLASDINLLGGFDRANGWSRSLQNQTVIIGGTTAILASNLNGSTSVEGFTITTATATNMGGSSYAILAIDSRLIIRSNIIMAARGEAGADGSGSPPGSDGIAGTAGSSGSCDGSSPGQGGSGGTSDCGRNGGNGGRGGFEGANSGLAGTAGMGGTAGGSGGTGGQTGSSGQNGGPGAGGMSGQNGGPSDSAASLAGGFFAPASGLVGSAGLFGNGGGGGGGGGGQGCTFCNDGSGNGGGGGGAGGCGGLPGEGGNGGGGSFGIFIVRGSLKAVGNSISTAAGGRGGAGGNGGLGGRGGAPGTGATTCIAEVGAGGNGGRGGDGGAGGSGSGGPGGPSIGIYAFEAAVSETGNTFITGVGGDGGPGGKNSVLGSASSGPAGLSQNILSISPTME